MCGKLICSSRQITGIVIIEDSIINWTNGLSCLE